MMRGCFLICLIIASICFNVNAAMQNTEGQNRVSILTEEVITLEQAINLAMKNNRLVKNAGIEINKTSDQIAAARTRRYPGFFLSVLGGRLLQTTTFEFPKGSMGIIPGTGPVPAQDTGVEAKPGYGVFGTAMVNQPLSQQYRINLNLSLLETGREIAKEKLRHQQQIIINDVKHAYYGILQRQNSINTAKEAVSFYRELKRVAEQHLQEKTTIKSEAMEAATRLLKAEKDVLVLSNAMASQKEHFNRLLGRDIRTEFTLDPVPDSTLYVVDMEKACNIALSRRPEIREAHLKVKQAEYDRRIKKTEYIPDVSLSFNYVSLFNVPVAPNNIMTAGLLFTWDVFDWGRKEHELSEKSKTLDQAQNGVKETEAFVLMDVNNQLRKLAEARADIKVSQQAMETAKENLRIIMNRYSEKSALFKDVLEAQASLSDTNCQYEKSLLDLWTAWADFEKALGEEYR